MKTFTFPLALLFLLLPLFASAQRPIDAKVNLGSLITGGINVSGEYAFDHNFGLAVGLGRSRIKFSINENEFSYRTTRLIAEGRYYFSPYDGADRFYAGPYGKIGPVAVREGDGANDADAIRGVLGILAGYKWVANSNVVFELNVGVGKAAYFGKDRIQDRGFSVVNPFDVRLGIIGGYRF